MISKKTGKKRMNNYLGVLAKKQKEKCSVELLLEKQKDDMKLQAILHNSHSGQRSIPKKESNYFIKSKSRLKKSSPLTYKQKTTATSHCLLPHRIHRSLPQNRASQVPNPTQIYNQFGLRQKMQKMMIGWSKKAGLTEIKV